MGRDRRGQRHRHVHAPKAMQIEPSHLKRLEAGTTNPTLALLVTAAKAFRVSLLELLGKD